MAGSKKKKAKGQTRAKPAPRKAASKISPSKSTKVAKKPSSLKKTGAKTKTTAKTKTAAMAKDPAKAKIAPKTTKAAGREARRPAPLPIAPPSSKSFADKVRDCDAGTGIWFIVAGSVEHGAIEKRGSDGAVVIRTDAGAPEVVTSSNLFETADGARAARYR
jgi:hypothetical protein